MEILFCVISFDSTHKAMRAEKHFLPCVAAELIPTPREISANCGLSLKFKLNDLDQVISELKEYFNEVEGIKIYQIEKHEDMRSAVEVSWRNTCL